MGKATKGQAIGTGIISGLKIACGITVIVLFKVIFDVFYDLQGLEGLTEPSITFYWIFGLPFIIPGILGFFAAGFRNSVTYGIYMAFCIISCVVDGVFSALAFVWLFAMADVGGLDCHTVGGQCVCTSGMVGDLTFGGITPAPISVNDCNDINKLLHLSYGTAALMIIGWILCLAGSIVSCAACCCGQRDNSQVVLMTSYPGQLTVTSQTNQYPVYASSPEQVAAGGDTNEKKQYRYDRMY